MIARSGHGTEARQALRRSSAWALYPGRLDEPVTVGERWPRIL